MKVGDIVPCSDGLRVVTSIQDLGNDECIATLSAAGRSDYARYFGPPSSADLGSALRALRGRFEIVPIGMWLSGA